MINPMKKTFGFIFVMFFACILTSCGNSRQIPAEKGLYGPPQLASPVHIALVNETLLNGFGHIHEVDYSDSHVGLRLVIWADMILWELSLMRAGHDFLCDGSLIFIPISTHGCVDVLLPGQGYVINRYVGGGTMPWSGITFLDEDGQRHYFMMQQDLSGFIEPSPFDPDIIDLFEDGNLLFARIAEGARWYIPASLDENGGFDPYLWMEENNHLIIWFRLIEFENRVGELPSDWEPWW